MAIQPPFLGDHVKPAVAVIVTIPRQRPTGRLEKTLTLGLVSYVIKPAAHSIRRKNLDQDREMISFKILNLTIV